MSIWKGDLGNGEYRNPVLFSRYDQPAHGCGTFAPSLRYHDGKFYVFALNRNNQASSGYADLERIHIIP